MDLEREKLLNIMHYYSADTIAFASRAKLIKLIYFLDFLHYRERGRSVTGLEYYAWEFGPVPRIFYNEWQTPNPDFRSRFKVLSEDFPIGRDLTLEIRGKMDETVLSPSERDLMVELAKIHFRDSPDEMLDSKHFEIGPWEQIWHARKQRYAPIPYDTLFGVENKDIHRARRTHSFEKNSFMTRYGL